MGLGLGIGLGATGDHPAEPRLLSAPTSSESDVKGRVSLRLLRSKVIEPRPPSSWRMLCSAKVVKEVRCVQPQVTRPAVPPCGSPETTSQPSVAHTPRSSE